MADLAPRVQTALGERYVIERELGHGGMAVVFLATDRRHARQVAVKVLHPDLARSIGAGRFLREIDIAARLTHPHVLPLFDSGHVGDVLYYVMPYVAGESLRQRLDREAQLPVSTAVRIAADVAAALEAAHRHGIVHRDIKPENILLEGDEAIVADFGIARAVFAAAGPTLSEPGLAIGTPMYMSPEQGSGAGDVDARSDIYSLGVVLYEMLAGAPPFTGRTAQVVLARHLTEPPPPLAGIRPGVTEPLEEVVRTALEKVPADRYQTAAELGAALQRIAGGTGTGATTPSAARRRRRRWAAAAGVVVAAAAGAWLLRPAGAAALDPSRVLVFPVSGTVADAGFADDATIALVAALNSTPTLTGVAAREGTGDPVRQATRAGAAYAVQPRVIGGDSLRVVLTVTDVGAGTAAQRVVTVPSDAGAWRAGVRAAAGVLPLLIPSGERYDLSVLAERAPAAGAEFLLGERAYRNAQFEEAVRRFRRALEADTAFGLAAIRGALAAVWADDPAEARALAARALDVPQLTGWHRAMATGLVAYADGAADSALAAFTRAAAASPQRPEAWMAIGEAWTHLLPSGPAPDSAAAAAFRRARGVDPAFRPALPHLIEDAARRGDTALARSLLARLAASSPDSAAFATAQLVASCARAPLADSVWRSAVLAAPAAVNAAAYVLSTGGLRQPVCAEAAWRAMLAHDTSGAGHTYHLGAVLGLHGVLLATGRTAEGERLLAHDSLLTAGNRRELLLLHADAAAPSAAVNDALAEAERLHASGEPQHSISLWFLGVARARRGDAEGVRALAEEVTRRAAQGTRLDSLLAASLRARHLAAAGDTAAAVAALEALRPTGGKTELAWLPWEALAGERLLLARLLLARGEQERALRVASSFDAPAPIVNLMYLPESLRLRERAARELGLPEAREFRRRLTALGPGAGPRGD